MVIAVINVIVINELRQSFRNSNSIMRIGCVDSTLPLLGVFCFPPTLVCWHLNIKILYQRDIWSSIIGDCQQRIQSKYAAKQSIEISTGGLQEQKILTFSRSLWLSILAKKLAESITSLCSEHIDEGDTPTKNVSWNDAACIMFSYTVAQNPLLSIADTTSFVSPLNTA